MKKVNEEYETSPQDIREVAKTGDMIGAYAAVILTLLTILAIAYNAAKEARKYFKSRKATTTAPATTSSIENKKMINFYATKQRVH